MFIVMTTITASAVRDALGLGEEYREWVEALEEVPQPFPELDVPRGEGLGELLERLKVPGEDRDEIAGAVELVTEPGSGWRWLLERTVAATRACMGGDVRIPIGPVMDRHGLAGRWFYVAACLAVVPDVRALHASMGVSDDVSWASLGILGEKVAVRRRSLDGGRDDLPFTHHEYVMPVFSGRRYRLGGLDCLAGNAGVDVRLPYGTDPLPTEFGMPWATDLHYFFRRLPKRYGDGVRFGYTGISVYVYSWITDLALEEYLPEEHAFRRFVRKANYQSRVWGGHPGAPDETGLTSGDRDAVEYAFGRTVPDLDAALRLVPASDLQRLVLRHLRDGRHWALDGCGEVIWDYSPSRRKDAIDW
jgi:hypothetical protein